MSVATEILSKDDKPKAGELICALAQAGSLSQMGGKAWHLSAMLHEGFPIIPGFVVPNVAFQEFLDFNQLRQPIAAFVEQIDRRDPGSLRRVSASIRGLVEESKLPEHLETALLQSWRTQLPGRTLIVRSSAVGEDSQQASFAGQLDSILNVRQEVELVPAILACWASYWSDRSLMLRSGSPEEFH